MFYLCICNRFRPGEIPSHNLPCPLNFSPPCSWAQLIRCYIISPRNTFISCKLDKTSIQSCFWNHRQCSITHSNLCFLAFLKMAGNPIGVWAPTFVPRLIFKVCYAPTTFPGSSNINRRSKKRIVHWLISRFLPSAKRVHRPKKE